MTVKLQIAAMFTIGVLFAETSTGQVVPKPSINSPNAAQIKNESIAKQQLDQIEQHYETGLKELQQAFRKAQTQNDRQRAQDQYNELQRSTVAKSLKLAAEHAKTDVAAQALTWVFRFNTDTKTQQQAKQLWMEDHVNSTVLAPMLGILGEAKEHEFLRGMIQRATNKTVLGAACFYLAMSLKDIEPRTKSVDTELIALLERIESELPNVFLVVPGGPPAGKLGDLIAPFLFEFKYLSVGRIAPDIEGEDIDGVKFKLSDYRGKVVLISFWGHW